MEKFAIVTRFDDQSKKIGDKIKQVLQSHQYEYNQENPDTVFVVGGDGTYIKAIHDYMERIPDVKFLGLHTGTLGFFTDYHDNEVDELLEMYLSEKYEISEYPLLVTEVNGNIYHAVNEIRVENIARTQILDVHLSDEYLETFRGTGMCVCTQLGSTAYNRSLGGAVIQEGLDLIELSEIAGIHRSKSGSLYPPIVLSKDTKVKLSSESFEKAILGVDSDVYPIDDMKEFEIRVCDQKRVRMIKGKKISYFKKLNSLF